MRYFIGVLCVLCVFARKSILVAAAVGSSSKKLSYIGVLCALCVSAVNGFSEEYAADFLNIGIGGRALAMGGAFSSIADDGSAFYWNPAGLPQIAKREATLQHTWLFGGLATHDFISFVHPLPNRAGVGVSWIRFSVDDIPLFPNLPGTPDERKSDPSLRPDGIPQDYFDDREDAFFFSFGKEFEQIIGESWQYLPIPVILSFGGNLKFIQQSLYDQKGTATGFDFGGMFRINLNDLTGTTDHLGEVSIGISLQDIGGTRVTWNTPSQQENRIPMNGKIGLSYQQPLFRSSRLLLAFDHDTRYGGRDHWGIEYAYNHSISIRGGLDGVASKVFTMGTGIIVSKFNIDYAFMTHELGGTHRISGGVRF
jgi:hypothetical protein